MSNPAPEQVQVMIEACKPMLSKTARTMLEALAEACSAMDDRAEGDAITFLLANEDKRRAAVAAITKAVR